MTLTFERPIGAPADVVELEYCGCLRQTSPQVRQNASLTCEDVKLHILSRHGVRISTEEAEMIMIDLAGCQKYRTKNEEPEKASLSKKLATLSTSKSSSSSMQERDEFITKLTPLDLVQQTALLFIPELVKIAKPKKSSTSDDMRVAESVLLLILEEAGLAYGTELTIHVLRQILTAFGENFWSDEVLQEMIDLACTKSPNQVPILDGETFLNALTADTKDVYNVEWEDHATLYFEDVHASVQESADYAEQNTKRLPLGRVFTAPAIDYMADTYASVSWAVLSWISFAAFFFSYVFDSLQSDKQVIDCESKGLTPFGCQVANALLFWLEVTAELIVIGFLYIFLTNLGNSLYLLNKPVWMGVLAMLISIGFTVLSGIIAYFYGTANEFISTEKDWESKAPLYRTTLALACILIALQLFHLLRMLLRFEKVPAVLELVSPSANKSEQQTKQAASYKVQRMLHNALACHSLGKEGASSSFKSGMSAMASVNNQMLFELGLNAGVNHSLSAYHDQIHDTRTVGGISYTIKSLWSKELSAREGVWLTPRLFWCNLGQLAVFAAIIYIWYQLAVLLRELGDPETGLVMEGLTVGGAIFVVSAGAIVAAVASIGTLTSYVPSAVSTTFKFRGGLIPTLRNKRIRMYRTSLDLTSYLFGSTVWGTLFTSVITWFFVSVVFFLLFYDYTRPIFVEILSYIIAIATTIVLKQLILLILRNSWFAAFYRKRPLPGNIMQVALEAWNIGLSSGYLLVRAIKLILMAAFYVGRIDTPFLDESVTLFGIPLDNYATFFRKDILVHEAHRHPYMERWALLYLLKVRHGRRFGSEAGAAWRIVFTLALMPWLRKYRVRPETDLRQGRRQGSDLMQTSFGENSYTNEKYEKALKDLMEERALRMKEQALRMKLERELALLRGDTASYDRSDSSKAGKIRYTPEGEPLCVICKRKFPSVEKLRRHEAESSMHKRNMASKSVKW